MRIINCNQAKKAKQTQTHDFFQVGALKRLSKAGAFQVQAQLGLQSKTLFQKLNSNQKTVLK